jgi:circadian clock protein KaiC
MRHVVKSPSGIAGLDEITGGGLPRGRVTLVCGGPGCGKTTLAMEFLVKGAVQYGEPGIFIAFEETPDELLENFSKLGVDLNDLIERKQMAVIYLSPEDQHPAESGGGIGALFVRVADAINSIRAKRIVLDTVDTLFLGQSDPNALRRQLDDLFRWLKKQHLTTICTAAPGYRTLTRQGLEEYIADCVILLDYRVRDQILTRRLRIIKYRGSSHGSDEYPFLIGDRGIALAAGAPAPLQYRGHPGHVSTGITRLDVMMEGKGYHRGTCILVSGTPGSGKTTLAASFADSVCSSGERCIFFSFEESPSQIISNMRSLGIDLGKWEEKGLLRFNTARATIYGLEVLLATIRSLIEEIQPAVVILDPMTNLATTGQTGEARVMITQLADYLKSRGITSFLTDLMREAGPVAKTDEAVSPLIDTWLVLKEVESLNETTHTLSIVKSRGMAHSKEIMELTFSEEGIRLVDQYVGAAGTFPGKAGAVEQEKDAAVRELRRQLLLHREKKTEARRKLLQAKIEALQAERDLEPKGGRDRETEAVERLMAARIAELRAKFETEEEEEEINAEWELLRETEKGRPPVRRNIEEVKGLRSSLPEREGEQLH